MGSRKPNRFASPGEHSPARGRGATFAEKQLAPTMTASDAAPPDPPMRHEEAAELARQWRLLTRIATGVAVLTAPVFFLLLYRVGNTSLPVAIVVTVLGVLIFRGLVDVVCHKVLPWPQLFGTDDESLRSEDQLARRRNWFWRTRLRFLFYLVVIYGVIVLITQFVYWLQGDGSWGDALTAIPSSIPTDSGTLGTAAVLAVSIPLGLLINTILFIGPLVVIGIRQIKGYEPNETDWGVQLDDVRGQTEPKEEIRKIVELWQAGDEFERAGGKRERGMLFLGPPGTGKTMTAKAIATGFNAPFVSAPGSAFQQAFIGVDVIMVMYMRSRARRLARKWGGQCIVFIDEVDAVGMSRFAGAEAGATPIRSIHDVCFFGPEGSITPSGDLLLETPQWRDRLFAQRASSARRSLYPAPIQRFSDRTKSFLAPGLSGLGGSSALQSLLLAMDGIQDPSPTNRFLRTRINTWLDVVYVVPRQIGQVRLRFAPAQPRTEELFFIGACNVPIEALDPALTRPGRLGRHVRFRTPSKDDRCDIIDLYLGKVAHDAELDTERRRDELARITSGHSPAMVEQVCSLALTYAHHEGRNALDWHDLLGAITTVEAGIETGISYIPDEARAIAIHEAGHAVAGHVFMQGHTSTRLTIRPRGWSLGQHVMGEIDERYSLWRHEKFADLIWTFGAMAAEYVFYDESTTGVGGDVQAATASAATMVGVWGMAPRAPRLADPAEVDTIMARYEALGLKLMNRSSASGPLAPDPIANTLQDEAKRRMVAQFLGQAFAMAYWFVKHNRDGVERVAETLLEKREMYGDEVVELLDQARLRIPEIDERDEAQWPRI